MNFSQNGIDFLKGLEGLVLVAYQCSAGIWTIGYGHTYNVKKGDVITEEIAEQFLKEDLKEFEKVVNKLVTTRISQKQFDALVSFCFNVGPGSDSQMGFSQSWVLKYTNERKFTEVKSQFMRWNKAGGQVNQGLINRRKAEAKLYNEGVVDLYLVFERLILAAEIQKKANSEQWHKLENNKKTFATESQDVLNIKANQDYLHDANNSIRSILKPLKHD